MRNPEEGSGKMGWGKTAWLGEPSSGISTSSYASSTTRSRSVVQVDGETHTDVGKSERGSKLLKKYCQIKTQNPDLAIFSHLILPNLPAFSLSSLRPHLPPTH
jgi:hypothetical protein